MVRNNALKFDLEFFKHFLRLPPDDVFTGHLRAMGAGKVPFVLGASADIAGGAIGHQTAARYATAVAQNVFRCHLLPVGFIPLFGNAFSFGLIVALRGLVSRAIVAVKAAGGNKIA